jgi:regulator of sirC expression with transglutaminase-like and TPR domain
MRGSVALSSPKTIVQAISEFHCVLEFLPERAAEAHRGLAEAYAEIGNGLMAIEQYRKYLELQPEANDRLKVESEIRQLERATKQN